MSTNEVSPISIVVSLRAPAYHHDSKDQAKPLDVAYRVLHMEALPRHQPKINGFNCLYLWDGALCHSAARLN